MKREGWPPRSEAKDSTTDGFRWNPKRKVAPKLVAKTKRAAKGRVPPELEQLMAKAREAAPPPPVEPPIYSS